MEGRRVGLLNWPELMGGSGEGRGGRARAGARGQGAADSFLPEEVGHRGLVEVRLPRCLDPSLQDGDQWTFFLDAVWTEAGLPWSGPCRVNYYK